MNNKFIKISFMFVLLFCFITKVDASDTNLKDIENHWAKENITQLINSNVISGYPDGTFRPENSITIIEFLKMIIEAGDYTLTRVGRNVYPDFYIATAKEYELIDEDATIDFNKNLTRYEMVQIISKFIGTDDVETNKNIFKDLNKENQEDVLKLVKLKIINGYEDKTFRGENNITRAEAACVICKTLDVRDALVSKRKYTVQDYAKLSNYLTNEEPSYIKPVYEIADEKIKIYDTGRFAKLDGFEVSNEKINLKKVIKIIAALVNEKAYVGVIYTPSKYTISELKIWYGKDESKVLCGQYDFGFTYYEDKEYKLASNSLHPEFSDNCYLRIDVIKLWDEFSDYKNGKYVDDLKKQKLSQALKSEFGANSEKILEYIINKNIKYVTNVEVGEEHVEQKTFGKYIVNYYKKENGVPQFYIERK